MGEVWTRAERLEPGAVYHADVEFTPDASGDVVVEAGVIRRFLREAGYERRDESSEAGQ